MAEIAEAKRVLEYLYGWVDEHNPTNPETVIFRTLAGRYVYEHIIDSTNRLGARVFDPATGTDHEHVNSGYLNYLTERTSGYVALGLLTGTAVEEEYMRQKNGGNLARLPTIQGFHLAKGIKQGND